VRPGPAEWDTEVAQSVPHILARPAGQLGDLLGRQLVHDVPIGQPSSSQWLSLFRSRLAARLGSGWRRTHGDQDRGHVTVPFGGGWWAVSKLAASSDPFDGLRGPRTCGCTRMAFGRGVAAVPPSGRAPLARSLDMKRPTRSCSIPRTISPRAASIMADCWFGRKPVAVLRISQPPCRRVVAITYPPQGERGAGPRISSL